MIGAGRVLQQRYRIDRQIGQGGMGAVYIATDELRREFDRRDSWYENRDEVRRCLNIASDIDKSIRTLRLGPATEGNWAQVRAELNALADVFNEPRIGARRYK